MIVATLHVETDREPASSTSSALEVYRDKMTAPLVALWYKKGLSDSSHPLSPNRGAGDSTLASHEKTGQYRINSPSLPCKAGTWDLSGTAQYTVLGRDIGRDIDRKRGQCSAA